MFINNKTAIDKFIKMGRISYRLLIHLVEDILDLAKFDAGTFSLNKSKFVLTELLEDIKYIFENQCIERGLDFKITFSPSLEHKTILSDQSRIKQVLINLISNAVKFTPKGGIYLQIDKIKVKGHEHLKFVIKDTGLGISPQEQEKLFQIFGTIQKHKNSYNPHGTGIGKHSHPFLFIF